MTDDMTLQQVKDVIQKMDPSLTEDDEAYKAQIVMISSLQVGPNIERIVAFTGIKKRPVAKFSHNLRRSGIWRHDRVYADWFDEKKGGAAFILDTTVALGFLERKTA